MGAEKLGDAAGFDEGAGGALEGELDEGIHAVLVVHGLAFRGAVHNGGLDVGADDLHGTDVFVPFFLVDAPDFDEVAVVTQQDGIGHPVEVAGVAAVDAFVLDGFVDPLGVVAFGDFALAEFVFAEEFAAGDEGGALEVVGGRGENDVFPGLVGLPVGEVFEDVGGVVGEFAGLAELADIGDGALAGEEHVHLAGDGFLLGGVEDGLDDEGDLGVAGFDEGLLEGVEAKGEDFVAGGAAPEDAHDREAVGLADVGGEFDLALGHGGAVGVEEPLDDGLDLATGLDVGGLGRLDGHAGFAVGRLEHADALVDDHVGEADFAVGGAVPGEGGFAEVRGHFAAVVVLAGPEAVS